MAPRHQTLPSAQTASAREALQSFYCQLCQKGYSRMNDYEAHLSSYDHSHKQRLKDMKTLTKDPTAAARARKAEEKAGGVISIKLGGAGPDDAVGGPAKEASGGGFKKGGFKKSGFKSAFTAAEEPDKAPAAEKKAKATPAGAAATSALPTSDLVESDTDDEGYEVYDPRFPTD